MQRLFLQLIACATFKSAVLIVGLCFSIITGCAAVQGKSIKTYHVEYQTAVWASAIALEHMKLYILDEVSDELKTEILARRPDGTPVTVEVKRLDQYFIRISIRTGDGIDRYLEQQVSNQIQGVIQRRLSNSVGIY